MNPFIRLKEVIYTTYLGLRILNRLNNLEDIVYDGINRLLRRIDKMDQATQDAINAVKKAVTDGTAEITQTITDEGTDIKNKFDTAISKQSDPAVISQLNELAASVTSSFQSLKSGVQNLSDNVAASGGTGSGTSPTT